MITLVSGTNRPDSVSRKITEVYSALLEKKNEKLQILNLEELPTDFTSSALYEKAGSHAVFNTFREIMVSSEKFIFIIPEYNGSFPGVLKAFVDGLKFPDTFKNKKAALVGVSSGMQGAGLALSHFTDILNYCGTSVLAIKPKLYHIDQNFNGKEITNTLFLSLIEEQVESFLKF